LSAYYDFIEEQRDLIQIGDLEYHHIKSQRNYPDLVNDPENIIVISEENHDYATLLQCEEENFPLLCPWQASRLRVSRPDLADRIDFWMSRRGSESAKQQPREQKQAAGRLSAEAARVRGDLTDRIEKMAIINRDREYPLAQWHWRVNPDTGEIERKIWEKPEGSGWQTGMGPWRENRPRTSYKRRRVKCTITGHTGTQSSLARWQKNRDIDPSNREFID